jgi:HK97 gp10 family phage protein
MAIQITGIKDIDKKLTKLGAKVTKKILRKAMRPVMKEVQKTAKSLVPVDTGNLKKGIKVRSAKRSRKYIGLDVRTDDDNFIAKFVEYGTENQSPQPFMRPAFDQHEKPGKEKAMDTIRQLIEDEAKKK